MLSSIDTSGACSALKPTNIVPWSVTVPYGMLRRKIFPNVSWSVLATCESAGLSSSSRLSGLRRRGHDEPADAHELGVEAGDAVRHVVGRGAPPQIRPKAGHEVDAAHRRPGLAQRRDGGDQPVGIPRVELEICVRRGPQCEDAALR